MYTDIRKGKLAQSMFLILVVYSYLELMKHFKWLISSQGPVLLVRWSVSLEGRWYLGLTWKYSICANGVYSILYFARNICNF